MRAREERNWGGDAREEKEENEKEEKKKKEKKFWLVFHKHRFKMWIRS